MTVRFTPSARTQFLAAIAYIYRENPAAAVAFRHKAEKILSRLKKFPHSGRILPEFPDLPFREVIIAPYRFFYRIKGKVVWIVAVWHGAQSPEEPHET
ncbi:MAG: type II toxin-antitoxin system RelE/ParE family toxin [Nitrospirae bacterium]|nr:type II toxin-antitoxin system RelE/ParE family toxin [Nitrospirota bacterium]MCL5978663.1 type II toxin-antitoxin system RelE/ParE family toxin [Nitrospirota bacterium]